MDKLFHPTTDDLILFLDGELERDFTRQIEIHLRGCPDCSGQLAQLQNGVAAYQEYRATVLQPSVEPRFPEWRTIRNRAAVRGSGQRLWWIAAALVAAAAVMLFMVLPKQTDRKQASEILAKAEAAPQQDPTALVFTKAGRRWVRTTTATDVQHVRGLFVQSHYSWEKPLSARSFSDWRESLPEKQDQVSLVRDAYGAKSAYRLRTRTEAGVLRAASLTLRADTYHPTNASFEFRGEDPIEVSEDVVPENTSRKGEQTQQSAPILRRSAPAPTETRVGPEEELRVLAALDAVGANAEEPVAVELDSARRHVLVTALGLPASRQKEITQAVADLPATVVRFSAAQPAKGATVSGDVFSANGDSAFRHKLEEQAGGARRWQEIADRALDISSGLFARTHSLLLLAQDFGPSVEGALSPRDRETLQGLQQRQVGAIQYATRQLQQTLTPVMTNDTPPREGGVEEGNRHWQNGAVHLYEQAKILDGLLDRFVAGSYDEQDGVKLQKEVREHLAKVEALLREQAFSRSK